MSFQNSFDTLIFSFIERICKECDVKSKDGQQITPAELKMLWQNDTLNPGGDTVENMLAKLKKNKVGELRSMCKSKDLESVGKKYELITRLLNEAGHEVEAEDIKSILSTKKSQKKTKKSRIVLKKHPTLKDYFWHVETNFVMISKQEGVVGKIKENREGEPTVVPLEQEDYELAKKWNFPVLNGDCYEEN